MFVHTGHTAHITAQADRVLVGTTDAITHEGALSSDPFAVAEAAMFYQQLAKAAAILSDVLAAGAASLADPEPPTHTPRSRNGWDVFVDGILVETVPSKTQAEMTCMTERHELRMAGESAHRRVWFSPAA